MYRLNAAGADLVQAESVLIVGSAGDVYGATTALLRTRGGDTEPAVAHASYTAIRKPMPFWAGGTPAYGPEPLIRGRQPWPYVANPTAEGFHAAWILGDVMYVLDYRLGTASREFEAYIAGLSKA
jgi:hypothetical protein